MSITDKKEYIERYIKFRASDKVIVKGKDLYNNGKVNLSYKNDASDAWHFTVEGSKRYSVIIRDLNKGDLNSSCSCPFDWGSICKHTVASLLFIADAGDATSTQLQHTHPENKPSLRTGLGFKLENYRLITEEDIKDHASNSIVNDVLYFNRAIKLVDTKIEKDKIYFEFKEFDTLSSVVFRYKNNSVYISGDKSTGTPKLNRWEALALRSIARSRTPDLLAIVFNEGLQKLEKEALKTHGFDENDDFNQYFFHAFNEKKGLYVDFKEDQAGILPVNSSSKIPFVEFVHELNSDAVELANIPRTTEERALGFLIDYKNPKSLDYDDYEFFNNDISIEFVALIAKPNKTRTQLVSHFDEYNPSDLFYKVIVSENQRRILDGIKKINEGLSDKKEFNQKRQIIHLLANEKYVYKRESREYKIRKSDLQKIEVSDSPVKVNFELYEEDPFIGLKLNVLVEDQVYHPSLIDKYSKSQYIYTLNDKIFVAQNYAVGKHIAQWKQDVKMVKDYKKQFLKEVVLPLSKNFEIDFGKGLEKPDSVELDFRSKQVYLSEQFDYLIITPQVEYHHGVSVMLNHNGNVLVQKDDGVREYVRNFDLEEDFLNTIAALHPYFEEQLDDKQFYLHYDDFTSDMWFYKFFEQMQNNEVEVFGLKELKNFKYSPYQGKVSTSVSSGEDWFEVDVQVSFGNIHIGLKDIKKAVLNKQKYIQLSDGSVGLLPNEWFFKLEKYFRHGEVKGDKLTVSKMRFSIIDELFDDIDDGEIISEVTEKRKRLAQFSEISETVVPKEIKAELRPYQKEGLNWLNFLDEMGWGGILADDMGLGKTLQILTFIQHAISKKNSPNLIVVPTTLLFNWEKEIEKFAPKLKAYYHYGINRTKDTDLFDDYHLVFTTYGVLLRDIEILHTYKFNYLILDESQAIKNPASRRFKAANLIQANNRIALSGTPIENSTFDLYAQMSFVNKGFFGGVTAFKQNFSNMIDKEGDENIAAELQRLINPFILRRTKERVASELPSKTEDVIYCEMDTEQRKIYDAYRNEFKNQLLGKIEEDGVGKSKMMVLEALTRLRQICDSPVLLNDDNIDSTESVKIKEIVQHITSKTANHKILIFSQFVKMLSLVKAELIKRNIDFEYLDGKSTTFQREKSVTHFQEDDRLRVFLISLKAGGTGLNLTAADYVYILDPWWNPAVENQAIDRCYRIGQEKKVFAYRMICKDTVEEKILNLQKKKKKIAGEIVQTDENIMKTLKTEDIKHLFS